jgi:uncharacterized spore protein YtfJ
MTKASATVKENDATGNEGNGGVQKVIRVEDTIAKMLDAANVDKVYGTPVEKDGTIIIPAAEVKSGMGLGGGSGTGKTRQKGKEEEAEEGSGAGGGGGGHVRSRPVAIVVASNGNVRVEPVLDKTKIALTAILSYSILGFMLLRLIRKR